MQKLIASLGLLAFLGTPAGARPASNDDVSQLRALESTFATAMNNKDLDAVMSVYSPGDALLFSMSSGRLAFTPAGANIVRPLSTCSRRSTDRYISQ